MAYFANLDELIEPGVNPAVFVSGVVSAHEADGVVHVVFYTKQIGPPDGMSRVISLRIVFPLAAAAKIANAVLTAARKEVVSDDDGPGLDVRPN